ncbi:13353_t:CDS:2 [Entrophospora sp. SA101]|nr:11943_t:CDS:2 [Entrophospora sp. SA101]CAJ0634061.1 16091_t:CDS:2 [Entrophospora sp. SA101]CAJ0750866.1 1580_t:CDS:2 [Entrophospora sp. SA101]CAJ0750867.1 1581_t:CDS:2 [Entrophospora sp. SA101]CAJ0764648.1 13353_t:CDS:2 [Entrophospora sp. SA101]
MKKQPRITKINSKKSSKNDFNNTTNNNMKQETTRIPQKKRGPPKGRPLTHKRKVKKVVNKIVVCEKLNFRVGLSNKTSSEITQPINLNVNLNINVNADDLNNGVCDDGNDEVNNDRIVEDAKDDNLIISSTNNFLQNTSTMLPTPMLIDTQFINYSISPTLMPTMPPVPIIDKSYLENLAMEENNRLTSGSDSYNGNTFNELLNTHPPYVYDESSYIGNYYTAATMPYNNNNNMLEPNTYNVFNNYQYNNPLIVPSPSPNMFRDILWRINSGDASSFL